MSARKTPSKKRPVSQSTKKSTKPAAPRAKSAAPARKKDPVPVGDEEVTIDRRRKAGRRASDSGENPTTAPPVLERRAKVNRRRQIDPTTCERDYTEDEVEFMSALDDYKRRSGRMFPTCSEVLEVVRSLGYTKVAPGERPSEAAAPAAPASTFFAGASGEPAPATSYESTM